jgi:hypothetical protein
VPPPDPAPTRLPALPPPTPRRLRAGQRARWLAARTRNAARHGLLIASVGALVVVGALLLFIFVSYHVDRALAAQIAALPRERDTRPLQVEVRAARRELARLEGSLSAAAIAVQAEATRLRPVPATRDTVPVAPSSPGRDSAATDLQRQLARIRQAPLVESYRALAETRLLRDDARARAMIDSIEKVHAEREAYAALSGPDARYASMTARLTQLGQRLTRLAELTAAGTPATANPADTRAGADARAERGRAAALPPMADSALARARNHAATMVARTERVLLDVVALNTDLRTSRDALRARLQLDIPPIAMLLASLVLGVALGFGFVLWRELRRPTVGDEQELEALTRTRVIVHREVGASVRTARARRRADEQLPAIMRPTDAAWPLLHLTLTGIGDVARAIEVVADQPALAGAVALNLSAVAARESRATILVDVAHRRSALLPLLPTSALAPASESTAESIAESTAESTVPARWDAPRSLAIGRDTFLDIVLPRRVRSLRTGRDLSAPPDTASLAADLQRLTAHHDLAVFVTDHELDAPLPAATDVVLCARPGVTTLAWLFRTMQQLEDRGRRVRAVVLWSADLPLAG